MEIDGISRENFRLRMRGELRKAKPWQPDILLVRGDSKQIVIKDYHARSFLYRFFVGLFSIWHENRMYQKLVGIKGIPECYGKIDRYAIALEFIPGRTVSRLQVGEVTAVFFDRLRSIVDQIHARGIVVCDLRNRKNVMVTNASDPYVIDFCTAFQKGSRWNLPRNLLFRIFYQDDLLGIAKIKRRLAPELLSSDEIKKLEEGLFLQKSVVAVRNFCVYWLKKLVEKV